MRGEPGEMAERHLERMTEHLDLTPDQQDQIRQILEEAVPPPRSEIHQQIREVLTPEQQEKMDRHLQERPDRMEGRKGRGMAGHHRGRGPGVPEQLARQLQLTDEQRAAARELMTEIHDEQREETRRRIEELLTPEQREKLDELHRN